MFDFPHTHSEAASSPSWGNVGNGDQKHKNRSSNNFKFGTALIWVLRNACAKSEIDWRAGFGDG